VTKPHQWQWGQISKSICNPTHPSLFFQQAQSLPMWSTSSTSGSPLLGRLLALSANIGWGWKGFSLFVLVVSDKEKKFYNLETRTTSCTRCLPESRCPFLGRGWPPSAWPATTTTSPKRSIDFWCQSRPTFFSSPLT